MRPIDYILAAVFVAAAIAIWYSLALAGEPSSQWLWCKILGAC